jgi:hypothetical protein
MWDSDPACIGVLLISHLAVSAYTHKIIYGFATDFMRK